MKGRNMVYYVSTNGCDSWVGTIDAPFRTVNHAAQIAVAGDTVRVFGGVYRERVCPRFAGDCDENRIVYENVRGEHPIIKGSEIVTEWEHVRGTVWKRTLDNSFFGNFNPYSEYVFGDWLVSPISSVHLGDVYLNGRSMYEAKDIDDLYSDDLRVLENQVTANIKPDPIRDPKWSLYKWYAEVNAEKTTILCNFREFDPNSECVEINVRSCCFYPEATGINYITVRGFEMSQAACQWAPPTAEQIGMIGPHFSKGWIIENNVFHDAKCSAVSLGKERETGHNKHSLNMKKSGHKNQLECVYRALAAGWSRENVGSHSVRNNLIYDCGQAGIVGHLGCAFSKIEHNHIYNIGTKHEFWGHEMAGIKLHAAIDTVIENNNIHACTLGIWIDWQAQGTRVTRNLLHDNARDLMIEVTHGPCLVDNNVFMSHYALDNEAQGTAFVHNMFLGGAVVVNVLNRNTPYHFPHSTSPLGYAEVLSGDDRLYNNIFVGAYDCDGFKNGVFKSFSVCYDRFSAPSNYMDAIISSPTYGIGAYFSVPQPVWIENNVYSGTAEVGKLEMNAIRADGISVSLHDSDGAWILDIDVPSSVLDAKCDLITTESLTPPRFTEQLYENPDGTPLCIDTDICGEHRDAVIPGPLASLVAGKQSITVWKCET